jgi:hypothetical protein
MQDNQEYTNVNDQEFLRIVDQGVMEDKLSIKTVTLWSVVTTIFVIILIVIAVNIYNYFKFDKQFQQAVNTQYTEITNLKTNSTYQITTFEVIDAEEGIYRIPVDSAKTLIIQRYQNK